MYDLKMNGSGQAPCWPSIGNLQMFWNKNEPRHCYDEDSRWREAIWMPISPNSNRLYITQDLIMMIPWYSINSQMDYQPRCMKTSTPISNHKCTNNGDTKPSTNKRHLYTSECNLTVGMPHLHPNQNPYSTNGGELPETLTQWIPLKGGSGH